MSNWLSFSRATSASLPGDPIWANSFRIRRQALGDGKVSASPYIAGSRHTDTGEENQSRRPDHSRHGRKISSAPRRTRDSLPHTSWITSSPAGMPAAFTGGDEGGPESVLSVPGVLDAEHGAAARKVEGLWNSELGFFGSISGAAITGLSPTGLGRAFGIHPPSPVRPTFVGPVGTSRQRPRAPVVPAYSAIAGCPHRSERLDTFPIIKIVQGSG